MPLWFTSAKSFLWLKFSVFLFMFPLPFYCFHIYLISPPALPAFNLLFSLLYFFTFITTLNITINRNIKAPSPSLIFTRSNIIIMNGSRFICCVFFISFFQELCDYFSAVSVPGLPDIHLRLCLTNYVFQQQNIPFLFLRFMLLLCGSRLFGAN